MERPRVRERRAEMEEEKGGRRWCLEKKEKRSARLDLGRKNTQDRVYTCRNRTPEDLFWGVHKSSSSLQAARSASGCVFNRTPRFLHEKRDFTHATSSPRGNLSFVHRVHSQQL
ncbi:hypothetical protein Sjap_024491 [Stephania japonica]|uniref:Uncharacterized protein n=1 Tax=Stephania japonica TaxID=461633 RepID=A0AAP0EM51_9MAGN